MNNSMMNLNPGNNLNSSQISLNNNIINTNSNNNSNFKFDLSKFKIGGDNNTNKNSSSTLNSNFNINNNLTPAYQNISSELIDESTNLMIPDSKNFSKKFSF